MTPTPVFEFQSLDSHIYPFTTMLYIKSLRLLFFLNTYLVRVWTVP